MSRRVGLAVEALAGALAFSLAASPIAAAPMSPAAAPMSPAAAPANSASTYFETGVASWYGADFHGRRSSNGEIYDKEKLTCAHRTLPFGSYVLVRDLDTGSSVVVRVTDRGPFAKDRIIDLSEAAARILGMIPTGTARVGLSVIPKEEALAWKGGPLAGEGAADDASPARGAGLASLPGDARVRIQVASYGSEANARATVQRLGAAGLGAAVEVDGGHYRVVFRDLSPEQARLVSIRLDGMGYRGYSVTTSTPLR